jgi:hypothetical protein
MTDIVERLQRFAKEGAGVAILIDATEEIKKLQIRVDVLEMVIREDLSSLDCSDDLNRMIVEEIDQRLSNPRLGGPVSEAKGDTNG